jgi:hypothetical protein
MKRNGLLIAAVVLFAMAVAAHYLESALAPPRCGCPASCCENCRDDCPGCPPQSD